MKRYIIINPTSGRGLGAKTFPKILSHFNNAGIDFEIVFTEFAGHAIFLAEQAALENVDQIVCVGGDGTIHEVINGMMRARQKGCIKTSLAVVAAGTGNDFAASLGVPTLLEEALHICLKNKLKKIDVGYLENNACPDGRYFGNGIGIGFPAVVAEAIKKISCLRGLPAYLVSVLKIILFDTSSSGVEISVDGEKSFSKNAFMISVMNGKRMGGGFKIAPNSLLNDGMFDLCITDNASRAQLFKMLPHFLKGTQNTLAEVKIQRMKRIVVRALDRLFPVHADGEVMGTQNSYLHLELMPQALKVVGA